MMMDCVACFLGMDSLAPGGFCTVLSIRLLEMTLKPSFVLYTRKVLYGSFRASLASGRTPYLYNTFSLKPDIHELLVPFSYNLIDFLLLV
jgi:hypothetical protein